MLLNDRVEKEVYPEIGVEDSLELPIHPERHSAPEEVRELFHHMLEFIVVFSAMLVVDDELPDFYREVFHFNFLEARTDRPYRLATRQPP